MALNSSQVYLILAANLLVIYFLIGPATCTGAKGISTRLKRRPFPRHPVKYGTGSRPANHTRDCGATGATCEDSTDCCAYNPFGDYFYSCQSQTCQECVNLYGDCSDDTECCAGLSCFMSEDSGTCLQTDNECGETGEECSWGTCCGNVNNCIIDDDNYEYCSSDCSYWYGECSSNEGCCDGLVCYVDYDNECDDCGTPSNAYTCNSTIPTADNTCCDGYNCDPGSNTCQNCTLQGSYCQKPTNPTASTECCNSQPCTKTQTANICGPCLDSGATCAAAGIDTCCNGLKCGADVANKGNPICVQYGGVGCPCDPKNSNCLSLVGGVGLSCVPCPFASLVSFFGYICLPTTPTVPNLGG